MDNPKISVLVPVYNVEKYVKQCLDSLARQTFKDFEVICIDDGSTDSSPKILAARAKKDPRFRVITKTNSGYGASMNRGLDEARGDYIAILESDDYAERTMLAKLYKAASKCDADLAKANYFQHYDGKDHLQVSFRRLICGRAFDVAERPELICTIPAIWTGLYKRSWLQREGIRFRETPGASFQDTAFTLKSWFAARTCILVRDAVMHYRMDNPNSSVKTSDKVFAVCDELAEAEAFLRERPARARVFLPYFHLDKLGKYRWDYERLSSERRPDFVKRMRDEFRHATAAGELVRDLYTDEQWNLIRRLMAAEDIAAFCAEHPTSLDE